jgi:hypothetical protein
MASEFVLSMKSAHGKAAATMVEAMPLLVGVLGPDGTRNIFKIALENGRCNCGADPVVTRAKARTQAEIEQLAHHYAHRLADGVVGLAEAGISRRQIRQIFNDSLDDIQSNVQSIQLPEGFDFNDEANQKMVEAHFDLMDNGYL